MDYVKIYVNFLKRFLDAREPLKIVFDSSNGTTGLVLKELFRSERNIKALFLNAKPDGNFPAHGPNPWGGNAIGELGKRVKKARADIGIIFDGDGDRVFFVDDQGRGVSGDAAAVFISRAFTGPVILDVRAGYVAREFLTSAKRKVIDSRVGHFFIKKLMREKKIQFGAEVSGHYYFAVKDSGGTLYFDSGILGAIHFINQISEIKKQGLRLSDWIDSLPKIHRIPETNFKVSDKEGVMKKIETYFKKSAQRVSRLDGIKMEFGPKRNAVRSEALAKEWWFNVRPSNTEELLRLNLEAKDKKVLEQKLSELKKFITQASR